ncbi:hypothetical protein LINPERHAP2_LOCUS39159 [Linum perenne]
MGSPPVDFFCNFWSNSFRRKLSVFAENTLQLTSVDL